MRHALKNNSVPSLAKQRETTTHLRGFEDDVSININTIANVYLSVFILMEFVAVPVEAYFAKIDTIIIKHSQLHKYLVSKS